MLEKLFHFSELKTNLRTEILAGITTFLTMSYIIFLQPAILSGSLFGFSTGMDFGSVMAATCLASALASLIMGLLANYPVALAPGMGQNFFFVFTVLPGIAAMGFTNTWQIALGITFVAGILFLVLSLVGFRNRVIDSVSPSMKHAIAAGIGIFIAFIGMQNAGLILKHPGTAVQLNTEFASPDLIVFFAGLFITSALYARKVRGAILYGILVGLFISLILFYMAPNLPASFADSALVKESMLMTRFHPIGHMTDLIDDRGFTPPSMSQTFLKMDLAPAFTLTMLPFVIITLFMVLFDTVGTLIGVMSQAGLVKDNKLPRAGRALMADSLGTIAGAAFGTSTVTSYIESASGVEHGGRSGFTAVVVAILFVCAMFFRPIVEMIGSYGAITAPALVVIGCMMMSNVLHIDWKDYTEVLPCFLVIIGIPLSYNIGDGLALGLISYPIVKLLSGRGRDIPVLTYGLAVVLLLYFICLRGQLA